MFENQRSWSLLTFGGTMARCSPEARYDDSDCITVFRSKNEEAHHSPFYRKSLCFDHIIFMVTLNMMVWKLWYELLATEHSKPFRTPYLASGVQHAVFQLKSEQWSGPLGIVEKITKLYIKKIYQTLCKRNLWSGAAPFFRCKHILKQNIWLCIWDANKHNRAGRSFLLMLPIMANQNNLYRQTLLT